MEAYGGMTPDPADLVEAAHQSAHYVVVAGRDDDSAERFVELVDQVGLSTLAELWSERPARTLPGALWRLYLLRHTVTLAPEAAGYRFRRGLEVDTVGQAIAGAASTPTPQEVVDKIGRLRDIGAQRIYLQVLDLSDLDHLELIASDVAKVFATAN